MAFTGSTLTLSFLEESLKAIHDFSSDTFKLALYSNSASLTSATTAYTATGEVSHASYTAGGNALTTSVLSDSQTMTAYVHIADLTFATLTATVRGAMIYNSSKSNKAVAILDFGQDITKTATDLVVHFPASGPLTSLIRIKYA